MADIIGLTLAAADRLHAVTALDGAIWASSNPLAIFASPVCTSKRLTDRGCRIFAVTSNGVVYGFATDEAIPWVPDTAFDLQAQVDWSLAYSEGTLYVGTGSVLNAQQGGSMIALDAATGALKWSFPTGGPVSYPAAIAYGRNGPYGVVFGSGGPGPQLYAVDVNSGAELWSTPDDAFGQIVDESIVYLADIGSQTLRARSARDGSLIWSYQNPTNFNFQCPAIDGATVYASSVGNDVMAFDAYSGAIKWQTTVPPHPTAPSVGGGIVAVASGGEPGPGYMHFLDAGNGALLADSTEPTGHDGENCSDPTGFQVGTFDGRLLAFSGLYFYNGSDVYYDIKLGDEEIIRPPLYIPL